MGLSITCCQRLTAVATTDAPTPAGGANQTQVFTRVESLRIAELLVPTGLREDLEKVRALHSFLLPAAPTFASIAENNHTHR